MGTNYFLRETTKCGCGHEDVERVLHVGKSSVGWQFLFRSHPDEEISSAADWRRRIEAAPDGLHDAYDRAITPEDFWKMVEAKRGGLRLPDDGMDGEGYRIVEHEFS